MPPRSLDRSRRELADFLRHRRERLTPAEVGLPPGGRRRTKGLRREEVAALAGVGITWYTWFEQGREIGVSAGFLDRVARVLKLDDADRCHLFLLAQQRPPAPAGGQWCTISAPVQRILDDLVLRPAYVLNLRWDVVAWNRAADRLFGFGDRAEPNLLRLIFTDPELRRRALAWRQDAPRLLSSFRRDFAVAANDAAWAEFLQELERLSPEFRSLWRRQDADGCAQGFSRLEVAGIGPVGFAQETLTVDETRHLRLVVYLAQPGEANSAAFEAWLGTQDEEKPAARRRGARA